MEELPKKTSSINRVVGPIDSDFENTVSDYMEERFLEREPLETKNGEIIEEQEIPESMINFIEKISIALPQFLSDYGLKQCLTIASKNFHFVDLEYLKGKYPEEASRAEEKIAAFWNPTFQIIVLLIRKEQNSESESAALIQDCCTVVHESIHPQAFASLMAERSTSESDPGDSDLFKLGIITKEGNETYRNISLRRGGLSIYTKEGNYLGALDEAVTQELTKRFTTKFIPENLIINGNPADREEVEKVLESEESIYKDERIRLWQIIDDILAANLDKFQDREEVFKVFTNAYFSGNIIPLGKLIEKTYGRGSFRRLAEETRRS